MSTGGVHAESKKTIHELIKHKSGQVINLPKRRLYLYVMRSCSVALQKGVATAINKRTLAINQRINGKATSEYKKIRPLA